MEDLRTLKDEASKAFTKGKFAKAVELYDEVCAKDPKDLQAQIKLGDALVKAGNKPKAVSTYQKVAETYASQGFLPKAIAVCKVILEVDKEHRATQQILAGLYAKRMGDGGSTSSTAIKRPSTGVSPTPSPSPSPGPAPTSSAARPPSKPEAHAESAPSDDMIELDTGDHAAGGFGTSPAHVESTVDLDPVVEPARPSSKPSQPAAQVKVTPAPAPAPQPPQRPATTPPAPPPQAQTQAPVQMQMQAQTQPAQPQRPPTSPTTQAPQVAQARPATGATTVAVAPPPTEIDVPLELEVELSAATMAKAHPPKPELPSEDVDLSDVTEPATPAPTPVVARPPSGSVQAVGPRPSRTGPEWTTTPPEVNVSINAEANGNASASAETSAETSAGAVEASAAGANGQSLEWGEGDDAEDSINSQLERALARQAAAEGPTPLATPAEATSGEEDTSIEIAFDVPMASDEEEEIEVLSVTAELAKNAGRELPKIPLFSDLAPEAFVELMEQCGFVRADPGQVILREGDAGNSFFVVCSGKMKVVKQSGDQELLMAYLPEGAFFGEMALLSGAKRAATVVAEESSELLEISASILNALARRYPHVASSLRQFGRQRLLANVMATSMLFRPFEKADRKRLVEMFKVSEVRPGEVVVKEGKGADGLYLVMSGELEVQKAGKRTLVLATLTDGDVFGEMSLLSKKPASATVVAKRRSTVLRLPRERFEELIVTYPQVLVLVSELADARTRSNAQVMAAVLTPDIAHPLV
jgi:CRP-like cAMP-binding protein